MEIGSGVHSIGQTKGGRVHAFLFDAGGELTLIDTLFDSDAHVVLDYVKRIGRQPTAITSILVTHGHRSHLGGLATLKRLSGATVRSHEWEADIVSGDRLAQPVTLVPKPPLHTYPFRIGLALGRPRHDPCPVDEALADGDRVGPLEVMHIPGHSPGHLAFHWPERRVLVAGDAVATWPTFDAGWPGFNLNEREHAASIARLASLDAEVVGVGHGEPIREQAPDRLAELAEQAPTRAARVEPAP
jgi:glyoxylase-like metal-dependent hydrolase (beta-lactamase superfamily II)